MKGGLQDSVSYFTAFLARPRRRAGSNSTVSTLLRPDLGSLHAAAPETTAAKPKIPSLHLVSLPLIIRGKTAFRSGRGNCPLRARPVSVPEQKAENVILQVVTVSQDTTMPREVARNGSSRDFFRDDVSRADEFARRADFDADLATAAADGAQATAPAESYNPAQAATAAAW